MSDTKSGQAIATVWTIAEPGARTWREARDMVFNGTERLTVHTYADSDSVAVFVGCKLHYDNTLPEGVVPGTPDFYDWARTVAIAAESGMPFMECMPGAKYADARGPIERKRPYIERQYVFTVRNGRGGITPVPLYGPDMGTAENRLRAHWAETMGTDCGSMSVIRIDVTPGTERLTY